MPKTETERSIPTSEPDQQPDQQSVHAVIEHLQSEHNTAEELVDELSNRLSFVLRDGESDPGDMGAEAPCPLAGILQREVFRAYRINETLKDLLNRLEI